MTTADLGSQPRGIPLDSVAATDAAAARDVLDRIRPQLRIGPATLVWRRRPVVVTLGLLVACFLAACLSATTGSFSIALGDVITTVLGAGTERQRFIVMDLRLPRAIIGLIVGAALGMSGAMVQGVARNPLASPDILGVTAGAGAAAVVVLTGGGGIATAVGSTLGLSAAALAGGLLTGLLVYLLAYRGGVDGYRLILIGVAITALLHAFTEWMLTRVDLMDVGPAKVWLYGSLADAGWSDVRPTLLGVVILGAVALMTARTLGVMHLADDHAVGLGVRLSLSRAVLLICAVLLVGVATAAAGPVAFVAFVAPQIAMRMVRMPSPPLVASALSGAVLLVLADWIARVVLPWSLPVGVVTSMIGGPFMIYLLVRQSMRVTT